MPFKMISTKQKSIATAFAVLVAASGCSSNKPVAIESAEARLNNARADENIAAAAPDALNQSERALNLAERAWEEDKGPDTVNHFVYISERKLDLAREVTRRSLAEQSAADNRQLANLQAKANALTTNTLREETQNAKVEARVANARSQSAEATAGLYRAESERAKAEADALEKELQELHAQKTAEGYEIMLEENVLFDVDKTQLKPGAYQKLTPIVQWLNKYPNATVVIEGHTDNTGSIEHNRNLSQARAQAVAEFLGRYQIDRTRVVARGLGEQYPRVSNDSASGRLQNRRVEIVISKNS